MNDDFQAQRALLTAELTAIALAGGDTAKVRDKLAKLEERQQAALTAAAKARADLEAEHDVFSVERGEEIAICAARDIEAQGHVVNDAEFHQFVHLGRRLAGMDAKTVSANNRHVEALEQARQIERRIAKLQERGQALSDLRLTDQASDRDLNEAVLLDKDLGTLRAALEVTQRNADALQVPQELLRQRAEVMRQLTDLRQTIVLRNLKERVTAAEAEFLRSLRELVQVSGAGHPGHVYTRSRELDRYVHHGQL